MTLEKEATGNGIRLTPLLNDFLTRRIISVFDLHGRLGQAVLCALQLDGDLGLMSVPHL
jgi:hypothetical protein